MVCASIWLCFSFTEISWSFRLFSSFSFLFSSRSFSLSWSFLSWNCWRFLRFSRLMALRFWLHHSASSFRRLFSVSYLAFSPLIFVNWFPTTFRYDWSLLSTSLERLLQFSLMSSSWIFCLSHVSWKEMCFEKRSSILLRNSLVTLGIPRKESTKCSLHFFWYKLSSPSRKALSRLSSIASKWYLSLSLLELSNSVFIMAIIWVKLALISWSISSDCRSILCKRLLLSGKANWQGDLNPRFLHLLTKNTYS